MKQKLFITSPVPPSVNKYLNYRVQRANNGKLFVQTYKSKDSIKYEGKFIKIVQRSVKNQKWEMPDKSKYIIVNCIFYFPKHGMDTNNHWKLPLDVLKSGGVYNDDSKVLEGAKRVYIDSKNPRLELEIFTSDFVGIFDTIEHFESFKNSNCAECKKNPERCTVVTRALENRITGDINLETFKCNKIKK